MVITTRPSIISPVGGSLEQSITAQLPVEGSNASPYSLPGSLAFLLFASFSASSKCGNVWTISHGKGILGAKGAVSGAGGIRTSDTCSGGLTLAFSLCISSIISMALLVASSLVDIMASSRLLAVSTSANMSILDASALALSSGTPLLTSSAMYALLIASRFSGVGSSLLLSLS